MANTVSNYIEIDGNEEVVDHIDSLFENAGGYSDIVKFVSTFYENPGLNESGDAVMFDWMYDNVGSKWIYVENGIDTGMWNISSGNHPPVEFFQHLYKIASNIDPDVKILVKFEDESYEPVGAFAAMKDPNGVPSYHLDEDYDMEDPTVDMDWDDEDYDETQMEFREELEGVQDSCLEECIRVIGQGEGKVISM